MSIIKAKTILYLSLGFAVLAVGYSLFKKKRNTDKSKNYIIGDSQTPFIDRNSKKASRVKESSGKSSLWEGGQNLKWLKSAVDSYKNSPEVNSIIINIGTNGGFNPNDDIKGLVESIRRKFPNAILLAVKGSWGWGGNKNITEQKVKDYYSKFEDLGVEIIEPAIGKVSDPHGNLPIYARIGEAIDKRLS
jgi:hypothetical protein